MNLKILTEYHFYCAGRLCSQMYAKEDTTSIGLFSFDFAQEMRSICSYSDRM